MHSFAAFLGRDAVERPHALAAQDVFGQPGFALFQHFAHADDGREPALERKLQLAVDRVVSLVEVLTALGVAEDHVGDSDVVQHRDRNLASKCALFFPVRVLGTDGDVGTLHRCDGCMQVDVGWADDDFVAGVVGDERQRIPERMPRSVRAFCTSSNWRR